MKTKRPLGITIFAVAMFFFALSGIGDAIFATAFPYWSRFLGIFGAVLGLWTALGMWSMAPWTTTAYRIWLLSCVAGFIGMKVLMQVPWIPFLAFSLFIFVLLFLGDWYLVKKLRTV